MSSYTEARIRALPRAKRQEQQYVAEEEFWWELGALGSGRKVIIPKGRRTDGPSIPKWLKWLLGWFIDMQSLMAPSFIHDEMRCAPEFTKLESDATFLMCCETSGVRTSLMWCAFVAVLTNNNRGKPLA